MCMFSFKTVPVGLLQTPTALRPPWTEGGGRAIIAGATPAFENLLLLFTITYSVGEG